MVDGFDESVMEEDVAVSANGSNDEYLVNAPSGGGRVDDIASVEDSARKAKKSVATSRKLSNKKIVVIAVLAVVVIALGVAVFRVVRSYNWRTAGNLRERFPLIKQKL